MCIHPLTCRAVIKVKFIEREYQNRQTVKRILQELHISVMIDVHYRPLQPTNATPIHKKNLWCTKIKINCTIKLAKQQTNQKAYEVLWVFSRAHSHYRREIAFLFYLVLEFILSFIITGCKQLQLHSLFNLYFCILFVVDFRFGFLFVFKFSQLSLDYVICVSAHDKFLPRAQLFSQRMVFATVRSNTLGPTECAEAFLLRV